MKSKLMIGALFATTGLVLAAETSVIGPRAEEVGPLSDARDLIIWMAPGAIGPHFKDYCDAGFNFMMGWSSRGTEAADVFDRLRKAGVRYAERPYVAHNKNVAKKFRQVNRDGTVRGKRVDCSHPGARKMLDSIMRRTMSKVADDPVVGAIQVATEVRDGSSVSFTPELAAAWKEFSGGLEIPDGVQGRSGPHFRRLRDFPASRIVPDETPLLRFYRWWWKDGDGWNLYCDNAAQAIADRFVRAKTATVFEPGVRVPPIWRACGRATFNGQWTYCTPEPFNVAFVTAEQQAMTRGCDGQGLIPGVQIITYRSKVAPKNAKVSNPTPGLVTYPNTTYMTTPPDIARLGIWNILSRRVDGISYFPDRAFFDPAEAITNAAKLAKFRQSGSTHMTNPDTFKAVADMHRRIAKPFGKIIRGTPERPPEVGFLESFTSYIYSGVATFGWKGVIYNYGMLSVAANLSPYVLYEEDLAGKGIPPTIKVILAPYCYALSESAAKELKRWQAAGGVIIADTNFVPGIPYDYDLPKFEQTGEAAHDDAAMRTAAAELRATVLKTFRPYAESSRGDILVHARTAADGTDYLFVINDRRTAGDYVGQYGRIFEKGLPNEGNVAVRRTATRVTDLESGRKLAFKVKDGWTVIPVKLEAAHGLILKIEGGAVSPTQVVPQDPSAVAARRAANGKKVADLEAEIRANRFDLYRENVARSQDASNDHDAKVVAQIDLPTDGWLLYRDVKGDRHRGEESFLRPGFAPKAGKGSGWRRGSICSYWEGQAGFTKWYDGIGWYCRRVKLPPKPKDAIEAVELWFDGVDDEAWVWLNGTYIGQHADGTMGCQKPFRLDVTKEVKWGEENVILIRVQDLGLGGGIPKPIRLSALKFL